MQSIEDFFNSIVSLPSLPKVVQEVMQLLGKDNVDINQLAKVIEQDAVIAAKVLKMANSSFYGVTRAVKNIDDAVAIMGLAKLRYLVVASGVTEAMVNVPGFDLKRFWSHSLVAASISREFAKPLALDAEVAYLAGLLHNIGGLLLYLASPKQAAEIDGLCIDACAERRCSVERDVIGLDHCQVGEELALRWDFPTEISRVLHYYATPLDKRACAVASVVYVAVHIAHGLVRGDDVHAMASALNVEVLQRLKLSEADLQYSIEHYGDLLQEASAMM